MNTLYITGAGVSAESGIPTFRGRDGFWTIGSKNYTPQEMATRQMYQTDPQQFLCWYYQRFATYRHHGPNSVHHWLADKNLMTQNIDGLDGKAGNTDYIAVHGRLDQMSLFVDHGAPAELITTPWESVDEDNLASSLLEIFNIHGRPQLNQSYKPYVLLYDEYYSEFFRIEEAQQRMIDADRMVFMGTSFSVNITQIALEIAANQHIPIHIVDPEPVKLALPNVSYYTMSAASYIAKVDAGDIN